MLIAEAPLKSPNGLSDCIVYEQNDDSKRYSVLDIFESE